MRTIIILSKCIKAQSLSSCEEHKYEFHFRGVWAGVKVTKIILQGEPKMGIKKGEEYLLYVRVLSCTRNALKGQIVRAKLLEECWDKS